MVADEQCGLVRVIRPAEVDRAVLPEGLQEAHLPGGCASGNGALRYDFNAFWPWEKVIMAM